MKYKQIFYQKVTQQSHSSLHTPTHKHTSVSQTGLVFKGKGLNQITAKVSVLVDLC